MRDKESPKSKNKGIDHIAILLQDALTACFRPGMEIELIFSHTYLQSVAEK